MSRFSALQELGFLSYIHTGECFVLLPILKRAGGPQVCIQLVEADLVTNSPGYFNSKMMRDGIEVDDYGAPLKYHIRTDIASWKIVDAYGAKSGRQNVLHIFRQERPGQTRGVPFVSSVISNIKQLGTFNKGELAAAVIQSMFTVFIKSNRAAAGNDPLGNGTSTGTDTDYDYTLAPGAIYRLNDDEDITLANPMRPNTAYEAFIMANLREIGMAVQIPFEILAKQFLASYSASRASRIEAWRFFLVERQRFAQNFNQAIYEDWLTEEVLQNRIPAVGYFDTPDIMKAYCGTKWIGSSMGQLDELKEVSAAVLRAENGLSTYQDEAAGLNGSDFKQNARQLKREMALQGEFRKVLSQYIVQGALGNANNNQPEV
jgi:lambda family phage portal protein